MIYAWELSGNGFGQRDMKKDSAWGHFTEEHLSRDGDNRASFLHVLGKRQAHNREHLLYLWYLIDMHQIIEHVLNVLSKDVAVSSDGKLRIGASKTQNKRRKTIQREQEKREQKQLRSDLGLAMKVFVLSATEDSITAKRCVLVELEEKMTEIEVKEITAENDRVRQCYASLLEKQRKHHAELEKAIERLQEKQKEEKAAQENNNNSNDANKDSENEEDEATVNSNEGEQSNESN